MQIKTVTVIGANGAMGSNISAIFASFGNAKVYMVARNTEDAILASKQAVTSVKAEAIFGNLIPVVYSDLGECIRKSDLVIESVTENMGIKISIYKIINKYLTDKTIVATGTSGLSIDVLAEQIDMVNRERFFGIHFFNPPYHMTLCEFIPSKYSSIALSIDVKKYLESTLLRNVVEVKDSAAFMGNRIGFQFINLAMQFADKYRHSGGIDYIDAIMGCFTGRAMAPLVTADFVGLDVHKAIVDNIYDNILDYEHDSYKMPAFALAMVKKNHLGRKTGLGLYKLISHANGSNEIYVYDIETDKYRPKEKYHFSFSEQMIVNIKNGDYANAFRALISNHSLEAQICVEMLTRYVMYSIYVSKAIGEDIYSSDKVMATGFNWVPPLCVYHALNIDGGFEKNAQNVLSDEINSSIDIKEIITNLPMSKYDYRPFFKAKG